MLNTLASRQNAIDPQFSDSIEKLRRHGCQGGPIGGPLRGTRRPGIDRVSDTTQPPEGGQAREMARGFEFTDSAIIAAMEILLPKNPCVPGTTDLFPRTLNIQFEEETLSHDSALHLGQAGWSHPHVFATDVSNPPGIHRPATH